MTLNWIEIIGYIASLVIAISMLMSSIRLLRWINLIGATTFSIYGFLIASLPVGFLNGVIAVVDVCFLATMYLKKEHFSVISLRHDNMYLLEVLEFYKNEIPQFFPSY